MKKLSSTLLLVALTFFAFAQKDKLRYCKYTFTDNGNELCTAIQSNSFKSDKEAAFSINKLLEPLGLKANFILVPCANIKNCAATIYKEKRYIVYDLAFMQDIQNATKNNWTSISIMGHELGHHLNGHTLSATSLAQTRNDE